MSRALVVLTIEYPEPLLCKEIPFLSEAFDVVYILYCVSPPNGNIPVFENVKAIKLFRPPNSPKSLALLLRHLSFVVKVYSYTLFKKGNFLTYLKHHRSFLGYLLIEAERINPLKKFIVENNLGDAIFYDYWLVDSTMALAELKSEGLIHKTAARAHRFDLYDDCQFEKRVPFIEYRVAHLDRVFTISRHGFEYLKQRVKTDRAAKIELSYLGITSRFTADPSQKKSRYTVVSCSSLMRFKRVDAIARVMKLVPGDIQWIHFGDGPQMQVLQKEIDQLPSNINVVLQGNQDNATVLDFYSSNYVDLFISLSESEGLPVSMMEAASFGIPILATRVNGVPEIVTEKTGRLVDKDAGEEEIAGAVKEMLVDRTFARDEIRSFFKANFDAKKNYESFIKKLIDI